MPAYASATHKFGFVAAAPSSSSPGRDPPLPRGLRALRSPRPGERACFLFWGPPAGRFGVSVTLLSDGERGRVPGGCKWLFAMPSAGKFVPGAAFSPRKRSICGRQVLYTDLKFMGGVPERVPSHPCAFRGPKAGRRDGGGCRDSSEGSLSLPTGNGKVPSAGNRRALAPKSSR